MSKKTMNLFPLALGILLAIVYLVLFSYSSSARGASDTLPQSLPYTNAIDASTIPETSIDVSLDGDCNDGEYGFAYVDTFSDSGSISGTIYLMHDSQYLYACMEGASGTYNDRFGSLYLDTDYGQETFAESEDYSLHVDIITGTNSTRVGTGSGNYSAGSLDGWFGVATVGTSDVVEYQVPITATGGLCNKNFGLALYHHWVDLGGGDDYGWPSKTYYDAPYTWSSVQFANAPCPSIDLSLEKTAPLTVTRGADLTYVLTVTNNSSLMADNLTISDTLPTGLEYVSSDPGKFCSETSGLVSCALGSLGGSTTMALSITTIPHQGGDIVNTAVLTATISDPYTKDNEASVATTVEESLTCGGIYTTTADAGLLASLPDTPQGETEYLDVVSGTNQGRSLMAFNLTDLPSDAYIQQAILELTIKEGPEPSTFVLEPYSLVDSWDEKTVTWNSQPTPQRNFGSVSFTPVITTAYPTVIQLDVTDLARLWVTGEITQTSLALQPGEETTKGVFHSQESESSAHAPRLIIQCARQFPSVPAENTGAEDDLQYLGLERIRQDSLTEPFFDLGIDGALRFASFDIPVPLSVPADGVHRAEWFLETYSDALRLTDPALQLQLVRRLKDDQHIFYRQVHEHIPVAMSELGIQMNGNHVIGLNGGYLPSIIVDTNPILSAAEAEVLAQAVANPDSKIAGETQLRLINMQLTGLEDAPTYLTWQVNFIDSYAYYIDAHSGEVRLAEMRNTNSRPNFELDIDTANNAVKSDWCGTWYFTDSNDDRCTQKGCTDLPPGGDAEAVAAFNNIVTIYNWWWYNMGRDSYDDTGDGDEIVLYVHTGNNWHNAHFLGNGDCMEFGDGYTVLDIMGHEYGHAIEEHRGSNGDIGWTYENESGAIKESFADILAHFVDNNDWFIGDEMSLAHTSRHCDVSWGFPAGTSRSFQNPPACGQPDKYSDHLPYTDEPDPDTNDRGNVHWNSGIINKAYYLMTQGDTFNTYTITAIGQMRSQYLFYEILKHLNTAPGMGDVSNFGIAYANAWASRNTHGFTPLMACNVRNSFAAVGIAIGDHDCDGVLDSTDPDNDNDLIPNSEDNCPLVANFMQNNSDYDSLGNACDDDDDNDGFPDVNDNCPTIANTEQEDRDNPDDNRGDVCDDYDGDHVVDAYDNCWQVSNPDQLNTDRPSGCPYGNACDDDDDNDGAVDETDNCPLLMNVDQADSDWVLVGGIRYYDNNGDACDLCPDFYGLDNGDPDNDGIGNSCDGDDDNDTVLDGVDNCPLVANSDQVDWNDNGIGGACEDESTWLMDHVYSRTLIFATRDALRMPMPGFCTACGDNSPNWGYGQSVNFSLGTGVYAQIVDSSGMSVANTRPSFNTANQTLFYTPLPFTFSSPGMQTSAMGASQPSADTVHYWLELYPLPSTNLNQTYTMTLEFKEIPPGLIYLPAILRFAP